MNTDELIKQMAGNLPASLKPGFFGRLFYTWLFLTGGLLLVAFVLLPIRPDFSTKAGSVFFSLETLIFCAAFLAASVVAFRSAVPGRLTPRDEKIGVLIVALALGAIAMHLSTNNFVAEFSRELNFRRGDCGPILFLVGALEGIICFYVAHKLAPTHPRLTAFWIALSAGTLGLIYLQFICDKDSFSHLVVWHLTPIFLLAGVSELVGRKALRW